MATLYAVKLPDGTWKGDDLTGYLKRRKPGPIQIEITPVRAETSTQQIRYYRGVVLRMIAEHAGEDDDSMHEMLLQELAPKLVLKSTVDRRKRKKRPKRSKDMTTIEFTQFIDKARAFGLSFYGLNIPDPE
jgi:hypothetical protein